jgi:hypothetical protein
MQSERGIPWTDAPFSILIYYPFAAKMVKLPARRAGLPGHVVASRMRAKEIPFILCPLTPPTRQGLRGTLRPRGCVSSLLRNHLEFHSPVFGATFFGLIIRNGLLTSVALGLHSVARNVEFIHNVFLGTLRSLLRNLLPRCLRP